MMRSTYHPAGSATAQADLASLAGWTPSRRNFLGGLLVASAASAAAGTACAIVVPAAADPTGTSPRMADLIAEYVRLSAALDVAEASRDLKAFDVAAEARQPVLEDLIFERPKNLVDLAAKMSALSRFAQEEDAEGVVFQRLTEDVTLLAGGAK